MKKNNLPLALKYRPKNFKELIGQNVMVETIINSIKLNKLPNAYLLTGIRGTGKTTTARLIAKALNCNKNFLKEENCDCNHCEEISKDKHLDVIECDAASRTGVQDIREIIESARYKPTIAKYKVYIIDECHMLSRNAWNAMLKTLEETPESLKFVLCTTEQKKVPVTIKSRCQCFNLHRVSIKTLLDHLKKISKVENGNISDEALILIARAAEGSVRDSLSLLARALLIDSIEGKEVSPTSIRKMLGIADRSKILNLLSFIFLGDQKKSIEQLRDLINEGIEPSNFLNDLLEIIYFMQQKKNIGNFDSNLSVSEAEENIIDSIIKNINIPTLIVFWQLILKVLEEISIVSNPILSLEMLIVRLVHLKDIPSYEKTLEALKKDDSISSQEYDSKITKKNEEIKLSINDENEISKASKDQIINTAQTKPSLSSSSIKLEIEKKNLTYEEILSFEDLIFLSSKKREIKLKHDLEKNVNLIKFSQGKIDISFNQNLDKNFVRNLSERLFEWTKKRWVITLSQEKGQKSFSETQNLKKEELISKEKKGEVYNKFKKIFSDVELIEVEKED